jgi:replicative superfamily II helicase
MVDFKKKLNKPFQEKPLDPQEIYEKLDRRSDKGPLRPSQIAVLEEWHKNRRGNKDTILKMHTGQGKTLTGLLMLQSKLNETGEPVVYICPNKFLVGQTLSQAEEFGVNCIKMEDELPDEFINGTAILVTHIQKLFNGKSKFGIGPQSQKISALLIDDAHSCINSIKEAFTIKLSNEHPVHNLMLNLFDKELTDQGAGTFAEIKLRKKDSLLAVPYWAWHDKKDEVTRIFANHADDQPIKFTWPLVKDALEKCLCVITGGELEVSPYNPDLHLFGSYSKAKHKIFMSATLSNDAFLIKGLGITKESIMEPLTNKNEKWSGEKMILIPSLMNSSLKEPDLISLFARRNDGRKFGVVSLVPSFSACERWENAGAKKADSKNINDIVDSLKKGSYSETIVIVNRYDGIDLPDNACRILIIDSVPSAQTLTDRYIEERREGSDIFEMNVARIIEQGLGRGVRGDKDYCVVILLDSNLIKKVKSKNSQKFFSPQTCGEIQIGIEVTKMVQEDAQTHDPMTAFKQVVTQCLSRDKGWKEYYEQQMANIPIKTNDFSILDIFSSEALAEQKYNEGQHLEAKEVIQKIIDTQIKLDSEKGWYLQEIARYVYPISKTESNKFQVAAHKRNHFLFRPREGMEFLRVESIKQKRATNIIEKLKSFKSFNDLSIEIDSLLNRLTFGISSDIFERSFQELSVFLGFSGQRPDKEMKAGPDNLWALEENSYLLVECKNEALSTRSEIYKQETGQMNNSIAWFSKHYGNAKVKLIMVHPSKKLGSGAGFNGDVQIMGEQELKLLRNNTRNFFNEFKHLDFNDLPESKIQNFLKTHKLMVEDLMKEYSVRCR